MYRMYRVYTVYIYIGLTRSKYATLYMEYVFYGCGITIIFRICRSDGVLHAMSVLYVTKQSIHSTLYKQDADLLVCKHCRCPHCRLWFTPLFSRNDTHRSLWGSEVNQALVIELLVNRAWQHIYRRFNRREIQLLNTQHLSQKTHNLKYK